MTEITSVNDARLSAGKVCLIVTAPWCGMCKMMKPSFEKMASSVADVLFVSADADRLPDIPKKYGIKALPTAVLLDDGNVLTTLHGGSIAERTVKESFR